MYDLMHSMLYFLCMVVFVHSNMHACQIEFPSSHSPDFADIFIKRVFEVGVDAVCVHWLDDLIFLLIYFDRPLICCGDHVW